MQLHPQHSRDKGSSWERDVTMDSAHKAAKLESDPFRTHDSRAPACCRGLGGEGARCAVVSLCSRENHRAGQPQADHDPHIGSRRASSPSRADHYTRLRSRGAAACSRAGQSHADHLLCLRSRRTAVFPRGVPPLCHSIFRRTPPHALRGVPPPSTRPTFVSAT